MSTYKTDILHFQRKGEKNFNSYPLCEVVDGEYLGDYKFLSGGKTETYTKDSFKRIIETALEAQLSEFFIQMKNQELEPQFEKLIRRK